MSGSVRLCWNCQKNTWSDGGCVWCGMPIELLCPECGGPPDERVLIGVQCSECASECQGGS